MPPAPQYPAQFKIAPGSGEGAAARDQQVALVHLDAEMCVKRLTERPLRGCEIDPSAFVVPHHPARPAGAENANAIEDEQGVAVVEGGYGRVVAVTVRAG